MPDPFCLDYDGLLRLAGQISREVDLEGLLVKILTESVPWMKVEACSIFLPDGAGGDLIIHSAFGDSAPRLHNLRVPAGKGIVGVAMQEKRLIRVDDVAADPRFYRKVDQETGWETRALVAAPLLDGEECLGAIEFLNPVGRPAFTPADERLVEYFAGLIAAALVRMRAQAAVLERAALQRDLKLASELQAGLLPKTFPGPAQSPEIEVFARLDPAREVSGDLYDFFFLDEDHLCFVVGDVSGKGVAAGLFMAVARTMVRAVAQSGCSPAEVLTRVNTELCRENDAYLFITMILGVANVKTGAILCGLAGHNPPAVVRYGGGVAFGPVGGQPLGLKRQAVFSEWAIALAAGDALVIYTDGVTEATDAQGRVFGNEPLRLLLARERASTAAGIVQTVSQAVQTHVSGAERSDDITILVLRRRDGRAPIFLPRPNPLYQKLLAFRFLERGTRVHACVGRCAPWFLWAWREQADQSPHGRDGRAPLFCLEKSNFIETFVLSISYKSAFRIKNPRRKWEKMHTDPYLGDRGLPSLCLCVLVVILGDFKNHKDTKTRRRYGAALIPKAPLFCLEKSNFIETLVLQSGERPLKVKNK